MPVTTDDQLQGPDFEALMARLRQREVAAWSAVVGRFRRVTVPWLHKRVGRLPAYALVSRDEFVLEIFADSLAKFYDLFEKGHFEKAADLQSLLFKVAELKMKEAFARLQKEALIYRPESTEAFDLARPGDWNAEDDLARERALSLQRHLAALEEDERSLLQRFYAGEKLTRIAAGMGLSEENLRKRKQRALERLKKLMGLSVTLLLMLWTN